MKTKHYKIYKIISQVYYPGKLAAEQKKKKQDQTAGVAVTGQADLQR